MKKRSPVQLLGSLLVVVIFVVAAWLLVGELKRNNITKEVIWGSLLQIPAWHIVVALGLTIINYGILVCYDYLAFCYAKVPISLRRVTFAALTSYSFSYNFGATLAGVPLRYRLYSAWNLPLTKIVQLLVILALTFWFGVFFISGLLFVFVPLRIPDDQVQEISKALLTKIPKDAVDFFTHWLSDSWLFGILLLAITGLYVGASLMHRGSVRIFRWTLPVPPFRLTLYQIAIASADMLVAASVLYVLFPPIVGGYLTILEAYLVVFVLIVLSHVPGGWGVLELGMMTLLKSLHLVPNPEVNMPTVLAGIIIFRVIYFLLPLAISAVLVGWHEYALRKNWIPPLVADPDGPTDKAAGNETVNGRTGGALANGNCGVSKPQHHAPSE